MSNRIDTKIVLGSKRYKSAINTDLSVQVPLINTQKEIDEFDRSALVSLAQIFDDERQKSSIFRLSGGIDLIFYNAYSGVTTINGVDYKPFTNNLYYVNSENSYLTNAWSGYPQYFEFDMVRIDNNVLGYTSYSGGIPPHIKFVNQSASTYNWMEYISYPYENDYNRILQYFSTPNNSSTWVSGDGIPFYIVNPYMFNGQSLISFVCPVEHNLSEGEYVELDIPGWNGYNGVKVFQVFSLGNEGYNSDKYIFNLYNNGYTGSTFSNSVEGTFKRIIDINNSEETKSIYYVRKHKIITNINETIFTKAAFNLNAFSNNRQFEYCSQTPDQTSKITQKEGNQSYLISFSKDIDISLYRDNLNRPITELFITIVNRGYFGWMNAPITSNLGVREGYEYNLTTSVSPYWSLTNFNVNISNIQNTSYTRTQGTKVFTFYYNKELVSGDTLNGDFCEFNQYELKERVISEIHHKLWINPFLLKTNLTPTLNPDGYYYKPHHGIKLREYSDYIEEGILDEIDNVPYYAYYSSYSNKLIWRDLYTYGYKDENGNGVDYPFLNGTHYPPTKIIFKLFPEGNIRDNNSAIADPITDDCE